MVYEFPDFTFILGNSVDVFDYFKVDELHGLHRSQCYDSAHDAHIAGLCNVHPDDHSKLFLFINRNRLGNGYKDALLIMHEAMHLSFYLHTRNEAGVQDEEQLITTAEEIADQIITYLISQNILT